MRSLTGKTADDVWRAAAALYSPGGPAHFQSGRGGGTTELLHVIFEIADARQRWVVSRVPPINPAFALVEVFWMAMGRQDARIPAFWNPRLPGFCGDTPLLAGAYGYRLRAHFGIDQLDRVYRALDALPDTRQAVLQIWDPEADLPRDDGAPVREDIPCNVIAIPKLRAGRLEWLQVMRSNDLFRGFPYNVAQFTSLQEILAGWLGVELGSYHHLSDSLHVYVNDLSTVRASVTAVDIPHSSASLALPRRESEIVLCNVMRRLEAMTAGPGNPAKLRALAFAGDTPPAYEDAVRIAAADAARRYGWRDLADECAIGCQNAALQLLWARWRDRVGKDSPTKRAVVDVMSDSASRGPNAWR